MWQLTYICSDVFTSSRSARSPWSPNGAWLATISSVNGGLYLIEVATGKQLKITEDVSVDDFVWSPDSQSILYTTFDVDGIWQLDIEDRKTSHLTNSGYYPNYSPDGKRISYILERESQEFGRYDVYLMAADGSNQQLIYRGIVGAIPLWLPIVDLPMKHSYLLASSILLILLSFLLR